MSNDACVSRSQTASERETQARGSFPQPLPAVRTFHGLEWERFSAKTARSPQLVQKAVVLRGHLLARPRRPLDGKRTVTTGALCWSLMEVIRKTHLLLTVWAGDLERHGAS